MSTDKAYEKVRRAQPAIVYLSGKTCTGKTTFANKLKAACGYEVIELDQVVQDAVVRPLGLQNDEGDVFVSVYKTADRPEWVEMFVAEAQSRIRGLLEQGKKVAIDGAIANTDVVHRVLDTLPDTVVIYFHPAATSKDYLRNITERFKDTSANHRNGLPNAFWNLIDPAVFRQFCQNRHLTPELKQCITNYARHSSQESTSRLENFRQSFPAIQVVEV